MTDVLGNIARYRHVDGGQKRTQTLQKGAAGMLIQDKHGRVMKEWKKVVAQVVNAISYWWAGRPLPAQLIALLDATPIGKLYGPKGSETRPKHARGSRRALFNCLFLCFLLLFFLACVLHPSLAGVARYMPPVSRDGDVKAEWGGFSAFPVPKLIVTSTHADGVSSSKTALHIAAGNDQMCSRFQTWTPEQCKLSAAENRSAVEPWLELPVEQLAALRIDAGGGSLPGADKNPHHLNEKSIVSTPGLDFTVTDVHPNEAVLLQFETLHLVSKVCPEKNTPTLCEK